MKVDDEDELVDLSDLVDADMDALLENASDLIGDAEDALSDLMGLDGKTKIFIRPTTFIMVAIKGYYDIFVTQGHNWPVEGGDGNDNDDGFCPFDLFLNYAGTYNSIICFTSTLPNKLTFYMFYWWSWSTLGLEKVGRRADAPVPCVARSSAPIILTMQNNMSLSSMRKNFNYLRHIWQNDRIVNTCFCFCLKIYHVKSKDSHSVLYFQWNQLRRQKTRGYLLKRNARKVQ